MRVELRTEGGIAFFPGLSKPVVIDDATLSAQQADELDRLLDETAFFEQPERVGTAVLGAADYRSYTISVDDGERQHTITLTEPIQDVRLQELLQFLQTQAKEQRAQARAQTRNADATPAKPTPAADAPTLSDDPAPAEPPSRTRKPASDE